MAEQSWFDKLSARKQNSILWRADCEDGTLNAWTAPNPGMAGGGIFNTGSATVAVMNNCHYGRYGVECTIHNAIHAQNGPQACRLMRWTDKPWDQGGKCFPPTAFYSAWMMIPNAYNPTKYPPWDPGDGGWWNVFQFKADDADGVSRPMWALNVANKDGKLWYYLWSSKLKKDFGTPVNELKPERWYHIEAQYVCHPVNGRITLWVDGIQRIAARGPTVVRDRRAVWGIGNYTDHIDGPDGLGNATVHFDDCAVSTLRLGG